MVKVFLFGFSDEAVIKKTQSRRFQDSHHSLKKINCIDWHWPAICTLISRKLQEVAVFVLLAKDSWKAYR